MTSDSKVFIERWKELVPSHVTAKSSVRLKRTHRVPTDARRNGSSPPIPSRWCTGTGLQFLWVDLHPQVACELPVEAKGTESREKGRVTPPTGTRDRDWHC